MINSFSFENEEMEKSEEEKEMKNEIEEKLDGFENFSVPLLQNINSVYFLKKS